MNSGAAGETSVCQRKQGGRSVRLRGKTRVMSADGFVDGAAGYFITYCKCIVFSEFRGAVGPMAVVYYHRDRRQRPDAADPSQHAGLVR
jgi:hypothetical protein